MRGTEPILLEAEGPDDEPRSDPIRTLVLPLWRSRWLIAATVIVGAGIGLFLGLMQPNTYRSVGKLELIWGAIEEITPESMVEGTTGQRRMPRDPMSSELVVLTKEAVFERVAREVSPFELFTPYDPAAMDDESTPRVRRLFHQAQAWWFSRGASLASDSGGHQLDNCDRCVSMAAYQLQRLISVQSAYNSSLITVSYATHDPGLAKRVVDAYLSAAQHAHRERNNTGEDLEMARERLAQAEAQKERADRNFYQVKDECGFKDWDKAKDELDARKSELEAKRDELAMQIEQTEGTLEVKRSALEEERNQPYKEEVEIPDPIANEDRDPLNKRLRDLEAKLVKLNSRTGGLIKDKNEEIEATIAELDRVRTQLKELPLVVQPDPVTRTVPNTEIATLEKEVIELDSQIAGLMRAKDSTELALDRVSKERDAADSCEQSWRAASGVAKRAQDQVDADLLTLRKLEEFHELDQADYSNLTPIGDATYPRDKEGPKRAKLLLVGLILGGMAGAALAFVRHLTDKTVRSPYDVERLLGMQVVGVLPKRSLPRSIRRAMRRAAL
jgi:uncharacterized protein involved in exopolysaccharide biosynthesis